MLASGLIYWTWTAAAQVPRLDLSLEDGTPRFLLLGTAATNQVYRLLGSTNLTDWEELALLHDAPFVYADRDSTTKDRRYYRFEVWPKTGETDWKNQIRFPDDPFVNWAAHTLGWVKFAILLDQPSRVIFQDSVKYPFHYDFAVNRLSAFKGMSSEEFYRVSMRRENQQVVLGTVLQRMGSTSEYGIQFSGVDPYPPDRLIEWIETVTRAVNAKRAVQALYLPAFEQASSAERDRNLLAIRGIRVSSLEQWLSDETAVCYSLGWAIGRLIFVPWTEINAAFANGQLRSTDILLTDGVPAEMPFVAGIITLVPVTPNSHVAILARSHEIPFVCPLEAAERDRARDLVGKDVLLRAVRRDGRAEAKILDMENKLDPTVKGEILALKVPAPIRILPKSRYGAISVSVTNLVPADIRFVGGKAANFGLLHRTIPSNSPEAMAFSFDLWDDFLDQSLPAGRTLRAEIASRLAGFAYPPDLKALEPELAGVRDLITGTAQFSPSQQLAIISALAGFDPRRNIRFRSSSNVEDTEQFVGAGLYDSFSGCLADDLDEDTVGPCRCDSAEPKERGVFRAIRKVYASFYNANAYLERLRHRIDESQVGMGLLVHHSFPDEIELANGVATLSAHRFGEFQPYVYSAELVTQAGAVPVANADGSARAEIVQAHQPSIGEEFFDLTLKGGSSLLPLGATVLTWPKEYRDLLALLQKIATGYQEFVPDGAGYTLDFEYKKIGLGDLVVKQVRELPSPGSGRYPRRFLLNEPGAYCVDQDARGRWEDRAIFATHRLKSRWNLHTRNLWLNDTNLASSFFVGELEYLDGTEVKTLSGPLSEWPGAWHRVTPDSFETGWTIGSGDNREQATLNASFQSFEAGSEMPVLIQSDYRLQFTATRGSDPPDAVRLVLSPVITPDLPAESVIVATNGVTVVATVFRAARDPIPGDPTFVAFKETSIAGLTTTPFTLRGYYSQTRGVHWGSHNGFDEFLFEPALEPGLPPALLQESKANNVRYVHVHDPANIVAGWYTPQYRITLIGFDGTTRRIN